MIGNQCRSKLAVFFECMTKLDEDSAVIGMSLEMGSIVMNRIGPLLRFTGSIPVSQGR